MFGEAVERFGGADVEAGVEVTVARFLREVKRPLRHRRHAIAFGKRDGDFRRHVRVRVENERVAPAA